MQPNTNPTETKNSMNGLGGRRENKEITSTIDAMKSKLPVDVASLNDDLAKWSKAFVERYDIWAGLALTNGKKVMQFARRHPVYTAVGVATAAYLLRRIVRASSNK